MQVFGLPGHVIRNAARASRLLSSPGAETARRADLVRRWRRACLWNRRRAPSAFRCRRCAAGKNGRSGSPPARSAAAGQLRRGLEGRVRELRKRFPAWGRGKIAAVLRREGIRVSDATGPSAIWSAEAAWPRSAPSRRTAAGAAGAGGRTRCGSPARCGPKQAVQVDTLTVSLRPGRTVDTSPPSMHGRLLTMPLQVESPTALKFGPGFYSAPNVSGLRPLIDEYMELYNGWRPHDSLDGMTPDEYLESGESRRFICHEQVHGIPQGSPAY